MIELSTLALVVGIACIFIGLTQLMSLDRALVQRLRHYAVAQTTAVAERPGRRGRASAGVADQINQALGSRAFVTRLQADLARANLRLTAGEFLLFQGALTFALMLIGYDVIAILFGSNLLAIPVFGLIGFFLPRVWLLWRADARLRAFSDQLPDTIVLMANALRAGMSLLQSMDMVAREAAPPISEEFGRVVREIGLGLSPEEALEHLKRRMRSDDVALLVTGMNVQSQVGGNLAGLLDGIAEAVRERVRLKGEVRTLTTQQRYSGYLLAVMPVIAAVLLALVNPSYILPVLRMPFVLMFVVAAISVIFGTIVIRKIIESIEI